MFMRNLDDRIVQINAERLREQRNLEKEQTKQSGTLIILLGIPAPFNPFTNMFANTTERMLT